MHKETDKGTHKHASRQAATHASATTHRNKQTAIQPGHTGKPTDRQTQTDARTDRDGHNQASRQAGMQDAQSQTERDKLRDGDSH